MKKITKSVKTPAPAIKSTVAAPAAKAAPRPPDAKPTVPAPALKTTVAPKVKKADASTSPAVAVVTKPKGARVTIIAEVDVGFGNALHVRGDEPALSWTKGVALGCISDSKWEIVLTALNKPFEFKFLVNDTTWSTGGNFTASPGDTLTLKPSF